MSGTKNVKKKTIDERFDEVAVAFVDQRDYTTFCINNLQQAMRTEIKQSEGRLTRRLDHHEVMLGEILAEVKALPGRP